MNGRRQTMINRPHSVMASLYGQLHAQIVASQSMLYQQERCLCEGGQ